MKIKICGITSLNEVEFLNKLQPDYIGLVFAESKRKIDIKKAKVIMENLNPKIESVAVFRNNRDAYIEDVLTNISVDIIQFHGRESNEFMANIKNKFSKPTWKGMNIKDKFGGVPSCVEKIILDSSEPGSGNTFNWKEVRKVNLSQDIFLAGGISLENIDEALKVKGIYGIDISSGVEEINNGLREKSYLKSKKIIEKVRGYYER